MPNQEPKARVSIEDLLRLKRAERPSAEFWTDFEKELRQKQLAALLEKRTWWQESSRWAARHAYLPLGAAAALAFAFVMIRDRGASPLATGETITSVAVDRAIATPVVRSSVPANLAPREEPVEVAVHEPEPAEAPAIASTLPGNVGEMLPWSAPRTVVDSPSARSIAENLVRLEQAAPELLETVRGHRLVAAPARVQAELPAVELASVSVAAAPRRSNRLLVGYQERDFTPEPAAPDRVRERIARRLGDPDLLDEVRRVDVRGDRLSLRL